MKITQPPTGETFNYPPANWLGVVQISRREKRRRQWPGRIVDAGARRRWRTPPGTAELCVAWPEAFLISYFTCHTPLSLGVPHLILYLPIHDPPPSPSVPLPLNRVPSPPFSTHAPFFRSLFSSSSLPPFTSSQPSSRHHSHRVYLTFLIYSQRVRAGGYFSYGAFLPGPLGFVSLSVYPSSVLLFVTQILDSRSEEVSHAAAMELSTTVSFLK